MKALPFKIPYTTADSFLIEEYMSKNLYGKLHTHPEIQITFVKKGEGTVIAGDYVGDFTDQDVFILGSDIPHVFKTNHPGDDVNHPIHVITIYMGSRLLRNQLFDIPEIEEFSIFLKNAKQGLKTNISDLPKLEPLFTSIVGKDGLAKLINLLEIIQVMTSIKTFDSLNHQGKVLRVSEMDGKRLNNIFEYTFKEYSRHIPLEEIADVAHMTPQSFCRFFKQRTTKTYVNFLNELRINKAAQLLKEKDKSVAEIALITGFNNLSHFNRQFKRMKKVTPTEYRG
ncbi:MAG: helix-turn-helix domain-containing protein [Cyclobacteriaceae bacterium]